MEMLLMMKIMKAMKKTLLLTKKKSNLMKKKHRTMVINLFEDYYWAHGMFSRILYLKMFDEDKADCFKK